MKKETERVKKKKHIENMFRDVKPTSDITLFTLGGSAMRLVMCAQTIFESRHLRIGFAEREDREDICIKASRFHFCMCVCVCA